MRGWKYKWMGEDRFYPFPTLNRMADFIAQGWLYHALRTIKLTPRAMSKENIGAGKAAEGGLPSPNKPLLVYSGILFTPMGSE